MDIRSFRDLRVWQGSMDLVGMIYRFSADFPRHETYGLTSQITYNTYPKHLIPKSEHLAPNSQPPTPNPQIRVPQ
jgi:hypothetical protein